MNEYQKLEAAISSMVRAATDPNARDAARQIEQVIAAEKPMWVEFLDPRDLRTLAVISAGISLGAKMGSYDDLTGEIVIRNVLVALAVRRKLSTINLEEESKK